MPRAEDMRSRRRPPIKKEGSKTQPNMLAKDEEANDELRNAKIPDELKDFLNQIAIPPEDEDADVVLEEEKRIK